MLHNISLTSRTTVFMYVLFVVLFSYRVSGAVTLLAKVAALLVAFVLVVRLLKGTSRLTIPREYVVLAAWFVVALISSAFAARAEVALLRAITLAQVIPLSFIVSNLVIWNGNAQFLWRALVISAFLSCLFALVSPGEFVSVDGRVYATLGNPNLFAILLSAVMCVLVGEFAKARGLVLKSAMLALAALFIFMIAASGSRKGLIGVGLVALIAIVFFVKGASRKGAGQTFTVAAIAAISVAAGAFYISQSAHIERMIMVAAALEARDAGQSDESLQGRLYLYQRGLEIFLEDPVIGLGLDNFQAAKGKTSGLTIDAYSHSNYIEVLTNTGLIGFCLYFAIYVMIVKKLYRCRWMFSSEEFRPRYITVFAIAATFIVYDFAMVSYYEKLTWIIYAGLIGETELLQRETRNRKRLRELERASA